MMREHASDARVLAGGQSLVPMMNFRLARPAVLVDLNRISDLSYIDDNGDYLTIGAMARERQIENSDLVRTTCPLLYEATLNIGHLPIRSRGTIGGNKVDGCICDCSGGWTGDICDVKGNCSCSMGQKNR